MYRNKELIVNGKCKGFVILEHKGECDWEMNIYTIGIEQIYNSE